MRAVGKAAIVPVCFAVNEPLLFAAPIVLNPRLLCPVCLCPDRQHLDPQDLYRLLGHERLYVHPALDRPRPHRHYHGPGLPAARLCDARPYPGLDFALYYPFFRAYDAQKCAEEAEISQEELAAKNAEKAAKLNDAFQARPMPRALPPAPLPRL